MNNTSPESTQYPPKSDPTLSSHPPASDWGES